MFPAQGQTKLIFATEQSTDAELPNKIISGRQQPPSLGHRQEARKKGPPLPMILLTWPTRKSRSFQIYLF